jgi:antirestriction protein
MRVYIASLSDYNDGRLEGKWFDLSDYMDASDLMDDIQEMLNELTKKYKNEDGEVREEWAVHDYEGIPPTLASEYMGEADFEKLMEIRKVAEDRDIPVEVLVERAGDTGSDDYEALADSLVMVVDGYDETNIVYELEDQLGDLGYDFWQDYIFITTTDQRLLYGEDVDRFREDILYENPDMDEDEAERQAEEMADEEESRRNNDLVGYIEELGYEGELPNWVAKDYNDAWKYALSNDYDVIQYDDQMYVFTNNYSVGGTILSGLVGAYIGYKIGRAKPQKKGFETEKKIGRKIKGAFSKKKYAEGGGVEGQMSYDEFVETLRDNDKIDGYTGRTTKGMEMYYLPSGHSFLGKKFSHKNKRKAYNEYLQLGKKIGYSEGGEVEDFSEFDFQVGDKLDLGSKGIKYFKQYDGEKIIVVDSKSDLKTSKGSSTYPSSVKKVLNRK